MGQEKPVFLGPLWDRYEHLARERPSRTSGVVLGIALLLYLFVSWTGVIPLELGSEDEPLYATRFERTARLFLVIALLVVGLFALPILMIAFLLTWSRGDPLPPAWYWRMLRDHPVWSILGTGVLLTSIEIWILMFELIPPA